MPEPRYRCVKIRWSTSQWCAQFCSTVVTWLVRVADERMLEVFDNDSIHRILYLRRRDCVPSVELQRRLCLTTMPALFMQRRLRWFDHAARRPTGELIKDLVLSTPPRTWPRRTEGQPKAWATMIKADLEPHFGLLVFGHARWRMDWVKACNELVKAIEPGVRHFKASTRPG